VTDSGSGPLDISVRGGPSRRAASSRGRAIERNGVAPASASVRVTTGTLEPRAEVLGAAALILAQSPHALPQRVKH
jgi:hypothetical protein